MPLNIRLFIAFRVLFNARWYYPILAVLFLDLGLSLAEYALLNVVWAATIVCLEVPSGALADQIGRRKMVVLAALLMVLELLLFTFAPAGSAWLFPVLLLNRILSGAAEASASGADEALAYDSLVDENRESEWPVVLASLMRWQAAGFFVAMMLGAAVFDADFLNAMLIAVGADLRVSSELALRFPLILTLLNAFAVLGVALFMKEPRSGRQSNPVSVRSTLIQTLRAARWIRTRDVVLFLLIAGFTLDSVIRLFLTVNSNYYRLIGLPDGAFGFVASAFAVIGFFTPRVSKALVARWSLTANFTLAVVLGAGGLFLAAGFFPIIGVAVVLPIGMSMSMLGFFVSHYLNAFVTDSSLRTTVLSFKGMVFNLAYGLAGVVFAGFSAWREGAMPQDVVFVEAMRWMPILLTIAIFPTLLFGRRLNRSPG